MKRISTVIVVMFLASQLFAQKNVGIGNSDPLVKMDVSGALALREGAVLTLSNGGAYGGTNDNVTLPYITGTTDIASFYRITGPNAAFSLYGITPTTGVDGQLVTLVNTTAYKLTIINNNSSGSTSGIITQTGANIVDNAGSSVTLQYNKGVNAWFVTATQNYQVNNLQGVGVSSSSPTSGQVLEYNSGTSTWTPTTPTTGTVTSIATSSPISGGTINSTGTISCPTCLTSSAGGNLASGTGIGISGNTISNTGVTSITGTANQVIASASTGAVTLSLPQNINTTSSPAFTGETLSGLTTAGIVTNTASGVLGTTTSIPNADLANSSITISNGTGMTGGGTVALGGTITPGLADGTAPGQVFVTGASPYAPALETMSGDATISSAGVLALKNTGTAGTYGSSTQVPVFTTDAEGRVTGVTNTTITGTSPVGSSLTSTDLWVGNSSNQAAAVAMSGDATMSNAGVVTLANTTTARTDIGLGTGNSPTFTGETLSGLTTAGIVTNTASGVLGTTTSIPNADLANSSITISNGTGMTGGGTVALGGTITHGLANGTAAGQVFVTGASPYAPALEPMSGDATISSAGVLALKNTGTAGTYGSSTQVPVFTTDAEGRVTGVTNTTITGTSPVGSSLTSTDLWVGNSSNQAAAVAMSGDATMSNAGVVTLANTTTARTDIGLGTGNSPTFTGETLSGLTTAGIVTNTASGVLGTVATIPNTDLANIPNSDLANSSITISNGTGMTGGGTVALGGTITHGLANGTAAGQVFVTGASPYAPALEPMSGDATISSAGVLALKNTGTAGTYGSSTQVPVFTTDAEGRVTGVTNTTITGTSPVGSSLTSTDLWVGNSSNQAAAVAMSGDATMSNAGVVTLANTAGARTDIGLGTGSSPTFTGETLSGLTAGDLVYATTGGQLASVATVSSPITFSSGTLACATCATTTNISGTTNTMPKFTNTNTIGNSSVTDNGTTVATTEPLSTSNTTAATSATTGAFTDAGGAGISGALWVGGTEYIGTPSSSTLSNYSNDKLVINGGMIQTETNQGTPSYPYYSTSGWAQGWNVTGGDGEVDLWNSNSQGTTKGVALLQQTGASAYNVLLYANASGALGVGATSFGSLSYGTTGQVLTSNGSSGALSWTTPLTSSTAVTTFSGGSTGLTPSSATSGAISLAGTLNAGNGGTGINTSSSTGFPYVSSGTWSVLTAASALSDLGAMSTSTYNSDVSGTSGQVAYFNGTNTVVSSANHTWNNSTNELSVGVSSTSANPSLAAVGAYAGGPTIQGTNSAASAGSAGVAGYATGTTTANYGVYGQSSSSTGIGVYGVNNTAGVVFGVQGSSTSSSTGAAGVYGIETGTGLTYGVEGSIPSSNTTANASGVYGVNNATTGAGNGVYGLSLSTTGAGVYGVNNAAGVVAGVSGLTSSATAGAAGILGTSTGSITSGYANYGVYGTGLVCGVGAGVTGTAAVVTSALLASNASTLGGAYEQNGVDAQVTSTAASSGDEHVGVISTASGATYNAAFIDNGGEMVIANSQTVSGSAQLPRSWYGSMFTQEASATTTGGRIFWTSGAYNWYVSSTGSADYSEYFYTSDSTLGVGEVVAVDPNHGNGVRLARPSDAGKTVGIVSLVGTHNNDNNKGNRADDPNYINVGMIGQVPVLVSTENGNIEPGDALTLSTKYQGRAVKATGPCRIIGYAVTHYPYVAGEKDYEDDILGGDKQRISGNHVMCYLNVGWYEPVNPSLGDGERLPVAESQRAMLQRLNTTLVSPNKEEMDKRDEFTKKHGQVKANAPSTRDAK